MITDFLKNLRKQDQGIEEISIERNVEDKVKTQENQSNLNSTQINSNIELSKIDLAKIHKIESITNLLMEQVKELVNLTTNFNNRLDEIEKKMKDTEKKHKELVETFTNYKIKNESFEKEINGLKEKLEKFVGLYELVTNQFNPFVKSIENSSDMNKEEFAKITDKILKHPRKDQSKFQSNENDNSGKARQKIVIEEKLTGKTRQLEINKVNEDEIKKYDIPQGSRQEYLDLPTGYRKQDHQESNQPQKEKIELARKAINNIEELSNLNEEIKEIIAKNIDDEKFIKKLIAHLLPNLEEKILEKIKQEYQSIDRDVLMIKGAKVQNLKELLFAIKFMPENEFFQEKNKIMDWLSRQGSKDFRKLSILLEDVNKKDEFINLLELWIEKHHNETMN